MSQKAILRLCGKTWLTIFGKTENKALDLGHLSVIRTDKNISNPLWLVFTEDLNETSFHNVKSRTNIHERNLNY